MPRLPLLFVLVLVSAASAQSSARTAPAEVIVRLSKELFEELAQIDFSETDEMQDNVNGMPIVGQGAAKGTTHVSLEPSDQFAEFILTVRGDGNALVQADVGPALARISLRGQFATSKRIRFDGGRYRDSQATTRVKSCVSIDRVCAKQPGIVGHFVEVLGKRIAKKREPEVRAAVEEMVTTLINEEMDSVAAELIEDLNQTTQWEETIKEYFPEVAEWQVRVATRTDAAWIAWGPPGFAWPDEVETTETPALMEMWVRTSASEAWLLELVADMDITYDLLRDMLPDEESKQLLENAALTRRGTWSVIQAGLAKATATPAAPAK